MRRSIAAVLAASFVVALAAPAHAAPERESYTSESADAYWFSKTRIAKGVTEREVWYVGAYRSEYGLWSDTYHSVVRCERRDGRRRCRSVEWTYGDTDLADGTFEVDRRLDAALIEGVYPLQTRTRRTRGPVVPTFVSVTFSGVGDASKSSGRSSYEDGCYTTRESWRSARRSAIASGTVGDLDLGSTERAGMGRWESSYVVFNRCDDGGEE